MSAPATSEAKAMDAAVAASAGVVDGNVATAANGGTCSLAALRRAAARTMSKPTKLSLTPRPVSIDEKHTTLMNEFEFIERVQIPQLLAQRDTCRQSLRQLPANKFDECFGLQDEIRRLSAEIRRLQTQKKRYLLDNSAYIFQYFEEKRHISRGGGSANASADSTRKAINSFFRIKTANEDAPEEPVLGNPKYQNMQRYWSNVNADIVNLQDYVVNTERCSKCAYGELISQDDEGTFLCNYCGVMVPFIVDSEKPCYKEPPGEVSYTAYVRLNHFKEILSQFQAKETTQIPAEVMDAIQKRIKKERITDVSQITYSKTREILRKLGYNKYFEHIQYINCHFGIPPPVMSEELVEVLCVLFIEIQAPWALHCPSTRTNFFNYGYTLYQLCRLVGADEYCSWIPLLKDPMKTLEQDEIWKRVCAELGWKFFPTPRH